MAKVTLTPEQLAKYKTLNPAQQKEYVRRILAARDKAASAAATPAQKPAAAKPTAQKAPMTTTKATAGAPNEDAVIAKMFAGRKLDVKAWEAEANARDDGSADWLKLPAGEHRVRLLPPVQDTGRLATLCVRVWVGPQDADAEDGAKRKAFWSPRCRDINAYCPATAAYRALLNHRDPDMRALAEDFKPEKFYLANALIFEGESWNNIVLHLSPALYRAIGKRQAKLVDPEDFLEGGSIGSLGIADPLRNRTLVITREGAGLKTRWDVSLTDRINKCTLDQLNARTDLDSMITPADENEIESAVCAHLGISDINTLIAGAAASTKTQRGNGASVDVLDTGEVVDVDGDEDFVVDDGSEQPAEVSLEVGGDDVFGLSDEDLGL